MSSPSGLPHILLNDLHRHTAPYRERIDQVVQRVLDKGWFILGPETARFEAEFAAYCGVRHGVGVGNGTDALMLALTVAGVGPGDKVLTAANAGFYGSAAILGIGADPLFMDIDPATQVVDDAAVAAALGRGGTPRAIILTHLYGRAINDMAAIKARAESAGIAMIEDCAQAHGARIDGRPAGSWGTLGCFSFYPTKNLGATGDGGMVVTDDDDLASSLRALRQYGWSEKYRVDRPHGMNSRLDEIQAAVLSCLLPELDGWNSSRRQAARAYRNGLSGIPGINLPPPGKAPGEADMVHHLYVIRTARRDALRNHLAAQGIATAIHYPVPDHRQAILMGHASAALDLPETERAAREILTLPCHPEITQEEVARVCEAVRDFFQGGA